MRKLFVFILMFFLFNLTVHASCPVGASCFNISKAMENSLLCPTDSIYLQADGVNDAIGRRLDFYSGFTSMSGNVLYGQAFGMAPGVSSGLNNRMLRSCERVINPKSGSRQVVDVAFTIAYQKMIKERVLSSSPSIMSRVIGNLVFRWIESYFGVLNVNHFDDQDLPSDYVWANRKNTFRLENQYVDEALDIANYAIKYGVQLRDGLVTYDDLVTKGIIWEDEWVFELKEMTETDEGTYLEYTMTYQDEGMPSNVSWNDFELEIGDGYSGELLSKICRDNFCRFRVMITGKGRESLERKFGMTVTTAFRDQRSASAYMMFFKAPLDNPWLQKYLLIRNFTNSYYIQTDIDVNWSGECVCETADGEYTGNYKYTKRVNDETVTEVFGVGDPRAKEYNCPKITKCQN